MKYSVNCELLTLKINHFKFKMCKYNICCKYILRNNILQLTSVQKSGPIAHVIVAQNYSKCKFQQSKVQARNFVIPPKIFPSNLESKKLFEWCGLHQKSFQLFICKLKFVRGSSLSLTSKFDNVGG